MNSTEQSSLPSGWVWTELEEIQIDRRRSIVPNKTPNQKFELYSVPSFDSRKPEIVSGQQIGSNKQVVEENTVLLCKINPHINRVWIVGNYSRFPKIASTEWIPFFPSEYFDSRYLCYFMRNAAFRSFLSLNISGVGGSLTRVRPRTLARYPFPLPPLKEQCRIATKTEELFTHTRIARQKLETLPKVLERFRQSVLTEAFRGELTEREPNDEPAEQLLERIRQKRRTKWGDTRKKGGNPANYEFHDSMSMSSESLPVLPSGWAWSRVDWVSDVRLGRQRSPKNRSNKYPRKYLRAANIVDGALDLSDLKEMDFKPGEFEVYKLRRGDVLLSEGSGSPYEVGKCAVWDERIPDCCIQNTVIRVRSEDIPPQYLLYVFMNARYKRDFAKMVKGIEINHLGAERLAAYRIPLAPKNEQLRICERIDALLAMTKTAEKSTEAAFRNTAELERSLLSLAFRGELVLQDPDDEPASVLLGRIRAQRATVSKKTKHPRLELSLVDT
jgi:type I restriction enzyme S subunit